MNENLGNIVLNDDSQRTKKIVNKTGKEFFYEVYTDVE